MPEPVLFRYSARGAASMWESMMPNTFWSVRCLGELQDLVDCRLGWGKWDPDRGIPWASRGWIPFILWFNFHNYDWRWDLNGHGAPIEFTALPPDYFMGESSK